MWQSVMNFVSGVFQPAADLIDNVHTSESEKLELRNAFAKIQNEVTQKQIALLSKEMDLKQEVLKTQAQLINAEAQGGSFLQRNWRPITMLTFMVLIVLKSLGLITLEGDFGNQFMTLVQIGLGGYVVGRSVEKAAPAMAKIIKK